MTRKAIQRIPRGSFPRWNSLLPVNMVSLLSSKENTMATATLTGKGQITIPIEVRQALRLDAGDRVEFVEVEQGRFEIVPATRSVTVLKGMFGKPKRTVSIDEMNAAVAQRGAAAR